jgi:hypothetical protein
MTAEQKEIPMSTDLVEVQATPRDMLQLAIEQGAGADALERIADTLEKRERWDAERAFNEAMCACQAELPAVVKTAENKQTKSWYAKLEVIGQAIDPCIHKHGFSQSFGTDDSPTPGFIRIICDLRHTAGHCQRYKLDLPPDDKGMQGAVNKTLVHGIGSTLSYGERYLTCMMFKVRLADRDNDGQRPIERISDADLRALEQLLMESNSSVPKFCEAYQITKLADLSQTQLGQARAQILRKMEKAKQ